MEVWDPVVDIARCPRCGQVHASDKACSEAHSLTVLDDVEFCRQPDPAWDIEHVTQQGSLEILYGPSDGGKSTLIAGRACCLATGTPWLGMKILRKGPVVALVFEGKHAFKKKIVAWKAANGFTPNTRIGVYIVEQHVNFLNQIDVFRLVSVINTRHVTELIVDTLAQSICADEENEPMQIAVNNAAMIRQLTGARVVFIHHSGKNRKRGARGGSALTAAADTVLSLDHDGKLGHHLLQCVRQRDGERFTPIFLRLTKSEPAVLFERLAEGPAVSLLDDRARDAAKLQAEVLRYVRAHPLDDTSAVAKGVEKRKADVVLALAALYKSGQITSTKKGRKYVWSAER